MSKHRLVSLGVVMAGVVVLGLGWAGIVHGKVSDPPKPPIDRVVGTWHLHGNAVVYNLETGTQDTFKGDATATVTQTGPDTLHLHLDRTFVLANQDSDAFYTAGLLYEGASDDDDLGDWSYTASGVVKGKDHLSIKGQVVAYDGGPDSLLVGTFTGEQKAMEE